MHANEEDETKHISKYKVRRSESGFNVIDDAHDASAREFSSKIYPS